MVWVVSDRWRVDGVMARLLEQYREQIVPRLAERLGRKNRLSLPRLEKIVVNMGVGANIQEKGRLEEAVEQLGRIAGQRPVITRAKKSVSGFRLREGAEIGCKVTLRGKRMYEFLDRLVTLALPRVRDFRGLNPKSFDGRGNYTLGLAEQMVFPEIDADKVTKTQGMDITLATTAKTDEEAMELLKELGMPFRVP